MIRWATERPAVAWALAAGVLGAGMVAYTKLPLSTRATIEVPKISVRASWPGSSPELIETWVTAPIEAAVQSVRGVRSTSSISQLNIARITVTIDPNADLAITRLGILERIEALRPELPIPARRSVSVENYVPEEFLEQPLITISVTGSVTPGRLTAISRDKLEPALSALPGVGSASASSNIANGVAVTYDPLRLQQIGVNPGAISNVISSSRIMRYIGQYNNGTSVLPVNLRDAPHSLADLVALPVAASGGRIFTVGELATVYPEEDAGGFFYRLNGKTAFTITVSRLPGADAIRTAALVRKTLDSLQTTLPPGVRATIVADSSEDLAKQLRDLLLRGGIALSAVLVVLLLGTRNVGGSLLILFSATVAVAGTALGLYLLKIPANLLTLAGLAMGIGILVQNGLVMVERLQNVPNTAAARAEAAKKIAPAIIGSTMTTVIVLIPFLYLQDTARAAFTPFAIAFSLALFCSIVTALILVPSVGRSGFKGKSWPLLARINRWLVRTLMRWRLLTQFATVLVLAVLVWGFINKVPRSNWGNWYGGARREMIYANVAFPQGTDPKQVEHLVRELELTALQQPGVAMVTASGGPQSGTVSVTFTPETSLGAEPWIASEALTRHAVLIGGATNVSVSKPEGQGFYGGSGGSSMVSHRIKILGYSFDRVREIALDLKQRLSAHPRVPEKDININAGNSWGGTPTVTVLLEPDRRALGRVGATARDYSNAVQREMAVPGGSGGGTTIDIDGAALEVSVKSRGVARRQLEELRNGVLYAPSGALMRLGDVSNLREAPELSQIQREDQRYIRVMSYDFRGNPKASERFHKAFMQSISLPPGFEVADNNYGWGDDKVAKDLNLVFALGIVLVLLSVAMVFNSVWTSAMVFLSLPIALGGVVAAYWVTNTGFTREATVGVILVVGLAVNHSILLIDGVLASRARTGRVTAAGVYRATLDRTEMIVLVTLTTIASLVPMAWGEATSTLSGAIALATAGGTIASTIGAMYIFPVILPGWKGLHIRRGKRKKKQPPVESSGTE